MSRISMRFAALKTAKKKAFIPFITAADPDLETFATLLKALPQSGCDLIEIGMPFSDPMADGPAIERANLRAFAAGVTLAKILDLVAAFRQGDQDTPIILMGYANPIYMFGLKIFAEKAKKAGVDGLIIADLPPEEDSELRHIAVAHQIDIIRLVTPTTDAKRMPAVLNGAGGFLYYVSVTGITGSKQVSVDPVREAVARIHGHTDLPVAVGFGISTPEQALSVAKVADAVVVGSAIVMQVANNLTGEGKANADLVPKVLAFVKSLADAVHQA